VKTEVLIAVKIKITDSLLGSVLFCTSVPMFQRNLVPPPSTSREAKGSSEMLVPIYQTTQNNIPKAYI
jgi:hypothetical protein